MQGVIQDVGVNSMGITSIVTVVNHIHQNPNDYFFPLKDGIEAKAYSRHHHVSKRWFLTTEPDGMHENKLDFLPSC
jgi:hypothetical protein